MSNAQNNSEILLKRAIVFKVVFYHVHAHTAAVSYRSLYTNHRVSKIYEVHDYMTLRFT